MHARRQGYVFDNKLGARIPPDPGQLERNIPKTAMTIPFGLFEYTIMSLRLSNAVQTFQRFIDSILRGLDFCYA